MHTLPGGFRMRLETLLLPLVLFARVVAAQSAEPPPHVAGATVSGIVYDSIASAALGGATVQLVRVDAGDFVRTVLSDPLGRYTVPGVPEGRYQLGFLHPMLDSLGIDAPSREVQIEGNRPVRADLAIPSPPRLRAAICGASSSSDANAVLVGVVRDARDATPLAGATVTGEWLEISFGSGGVSRRVPRLVATTGDNGWFAMCNVPPAGTMELAASRGADSTAVVEVRIPQEGFLRRELYLDRAHAVASGDGAPRVDGRLSGTVVAVVGGRPLADAQVGLAGGPQVRTNDRGEWTLAGAPLGTRMLEVRAVGHYPERRAVDVVPDAPRVRVALATLASVLDTVRVTASRLADRSGFEDRRRTGAGRYLTPDDVARRGAITTSDIFRSVPGLRLGFASDTVEGNSARPSSPDASNSVERLIIMRRATSGWCAPAIHVDGFTIPGLTSAEVDAWVSPDRVAGIEVYSATMVPGQFQQGMTGCGSIVIWTRARPPRQAAVSR